MTHRQLLDTIARRAMRQYGLEPDFPPAALAESARATEPTLDGLRDLRHLPWSSIDNDESRDLDQIEVCEAAPSPGVSRLLVGIADVDGLVAKGGAVDAHARVNTTTVYTTARIFPMLPEVLSTDRTSLLPDVDRAAMVVSLDVTDEGAVTACDVFHAVVRNRAKLAYDELSAWLEGRGSPPAGIDAVQGLEAQVRQQDRLAQALRRHRQAHGALDFDRSELRPVMAEDRVADLTTEAGGRARDLIEDVMVAANGASSRFLADRHIPSLRRVVRTPQRWPRIVQLAADRGASLPAEPDAPALEAFLTRERASHPDTFDELSLSVIKLLGRGEYAVSTTGAAGHFALAVSSYTHSTAPNRRFPDLVMQRLLKAAAAGRTTPYHPDELEGLAAHCTSQEDAANKVERLVRKAAAALWMSSRVGQEFDGVVTGASAKGTWVRLRQPPVEGKVMRGFDGLDVGDRVRVRLVGTDPDRGFIDFERA
jgi:VacB/RNase II family 3'-5' exoribonuclease